MSTSRQTGCTKNNFAIWSNQLHPSYETRDQMSRYCGQFISLSWADTNIKQAPLCSRKPRWIHHEENHPVMKITVPLPVIQMHYFAIFAWTIHIYFLRRPPWITPLNGQNPWTRGLDFLHTAYISVSKPTTWAVTGPHGQLASITFSQNLWLNYGSPERSKNFRFHFEK